MENKMLISPSDLAPAQKMWIQVISRVVSSPDFKLELGDMKYTLGNMIAKMVSSNKIYKITKGGWDYGKLKGYDMTKEINVCSAFYGHKHKTTLEHMVPCSVIRTEILNSNRTEAELEDILCKSGFVTIMLKEENSLLTLTGQKQKMPGNWKFGDDPIKRYEYAGIDLHLKDIKRKGRICR